MRRTVSPRAVFDRIAQFVLVALVLVRPAEGAALPVVALHAAKKNEPGKLTFIDPDTYAVLGSTTIPDSPWPLRFDATGATLHVFGTPRPGLAGLAPSKKPWTLSSIDLGSFASTAVGELGLPPLSYSTDEPSTRLYVVAKGKKDKTTPIVAFDLVARKPLGPIARVEHLTVVTLSPDGALIYALCEGKKHKRPKGPRGNLHVLDAMTGAEIARHDVGPGASAVAFDQKRALTYVLGVADEEGHGRVAVLRGAALITRFNLPGRALALVLGPGDVAYVLAKGAVVALTTDGLAGARSWGLSFDPSDLTFDTAHGRIFAGANVGSSVAELDLPGGDVLAEHRTGSPSTKAGKRVGLAVMTIFALGATVMTGIPVGPPGLWAHGSTSMALGPDGRFLYVLNPFTNDITLYETAKHDVVGFVHTGGGSFRIVRIPDDPNLWIESRSALVRLNTATQRIDRTIDLAEGLRRAAVAYDFPRGRAWILLEARIRVLDLRTGEIAGTVELPSPGFGVWIESLRPVATAVP